VQVCDGRNLIITSPARNVDAASLVFLEASRRLAVPSLVRPGTNITKAWERNGCRAAIGDDSDKADGSWDATTKVCSVKKM